MERETNFVDPVSLQSSGYDKRGAVLVASDEQTAHSQSAPARKLSDSSQSSPARKDVPCGAAPDEFRQVPCLVDRFTHTPDAKGIIFVMVGLPARGKSYVAMKLVRYLQWLGYGARVFNVGNHRRTMETGVQDSKYFDPDSASAVSRREELAMQVCDEMLRWTTELAGRFAVFDATNTTRQRRAAVANRIGHQSGVGIVFIESSCDDVAVLEANISVKLAKSPDYAKLDPVVARRDLLERVQHYEKVYEPLQEDSIVVDGTPTNISYVKLVNFASHIVAHNIYGRMATRVLPYIMGLHVGSRPVWLVRMPYSEELVQASNPGDLPPRSEAPAFYSHHPLGPKGRAFAEKLARFIQRQTSEVAVFCCTHRRSIEVGDILGGARVRSSLNPQDRGAYNGLPTSEIEKNLPDICADPVSKRFPGGESLGDVLLRLMPTLIEIEQEMNPCLVVTSSSVLQVLYCYYAQRPVAEALRITLPVDIVVEMRPDGGHFVERHIHASDL